MKIIKNLKKHNLEHDVEKLKRIIYLVRAVKKVMQDFQGETLEKQHVDAFMVQLNAVEDLALSDEIDLEQWDQDLEVYSGELEKIEKEIAELVGKM